MSSRLLDYPARVKLGLVLILAFALASSARALQIAIASATHGSPPDEISSYEGQLAGLRGMLEGEQVVGYVSDPVASGLSRAESRPNYQRYILTQYALAPTLVVHGSRHDLVIGNFASGSGADTAAKLGLTLLHDFGDGLVLFRGSAE